MFNTSDLTGRSIRFGSCVSIGLVISYLDGISSLEIARTALLASMLFLIFLIVEAALSRHEKTLIKYRKTLTRYQKAITRYRKKR